MVRPLYRSRQVLHALRPRIHDDHVEEVYPLLSAGEQRLFFEMQRRDQRHAIEVMRRLKDHGISDRNVLAAALLHDCGKGEVSVWLRVINVLSPALLRRLASAGAGGWRGAAHRLAHHPRSFGARIAEAAGATEATARFIEGNVRPEEKPLLAHLHAADDAS